MEDKESPNSRAVDEIPSTLGFDFRMFQVKDVESPNSHATIKRFLDEISSTSGFDSKMPHLFLAEVNSFHMIFNLNRVLIATRFDRGFRAVIFCLGLKEFL